MIILGQSHWDRGILNFSNLQHNWKCSENLPYLQQVVLHPQLVGQRQSCPHLPNNVSTAYNKCYFYN